MKNGKKSEKISALKRKAAAYMYSACAHSPGDPRYPATREQSELIQAFAEKNGLVIVKSYSDEGKTRKSLKKMMADIASGTTEYKVLLMRDITRWGRFETADEAARHEFACRRAGIDVYYTEEPYKNDSSVTSSIVQIIKRVVEGEYRREMAAKAAARARRRKLAKNNRRVK